MHRTVKLKAGKKIVHKIRVVCISPLSFPSGGRFGHAKYSFFSFPSGLGFVVRIDHTGVAQSFSAGISKSRMTFICSSLSEGSSHFISNSFGKNSGMRHLLSPSL